MGCSWDDSQGAALGYDSMPLQGDRCQASVTLFRRAPLLRCKQLRVTPMLGGNRFLLLTLYSMDAKPFLPAPPPELGEAGRGLAAVAGW